MAVLSLPWKEEYYNYPFLIFLVIHCVWQVEVRIDWDLQ